MLNKTGSISKRHSVLVSSESKKILCRRWIDIQKEEPEDTASNPEYPFIRKKEDKKNRRTKNILFAKSQC